MNNAPRLYQLQLLDLDIEDKREAISNIEERLGDSEELVAARTEAQMEEDSIAILEKQQKDLEWQAEDLRAKVQPLETKLYGGTVRNPKELSSMQQEIEQLKQRLSRIEDTELDAMSESEEHRQALAKAKQNLAEVEAAWKEDQAGLISERDALVKNVQQMEAQRRALESQIPAQDLATYENLRVRKAGKAVAKVERGTCQGCRISLPMSEIQRLRGSDKLVFCSSCGRILFLS